MTRDATSMRNPVGVLRIPVQKKILIKPLNVKPTLPEDFVTGALPRLEETIEAIFRKERVQHSENELYKEVESLCIHRRAGELFTHLKKTLDSEIRQKVRTACDALMSIEDEDLVLNLVTKLWEDHTEAVENIQHIYLYLDRSFLLHTEYRSIRNLGLTIYQTYFSENANSERRLTDAILVCVQRARETHTTKSPPLRCVIRMTTELGLYQKRIEHRILENTNTFYRNEGSENIKKMSMPNFLEYAQSRLLEEEKRVESFLNPATRPFLINVILTQLVREHRETLLSDGFIKLIEEVGVNNESLGHLKLIFTLFNEIEELDMLRRTWTESIVHIGSKLLTKYLGTDGKSGEDKAITTPKETQKFLIQKLLEFKEKIDIIWITALNKNEQMNFAAKEAWEEFINASPEVSSAIAQLLAKHFNEILRPQNKMTSRSELEEEIRKTIVLFRFLGAKDYFERHYKNGISRRLLLGKSSSEEAEKMVMQKLKEECGAPFTAEMEGMFKELEISRDIFSQFINNGESRVLVDRMGVEFECHALAASVWPKTSLHTQIVFPPQVLELQKIYSDFYHSIHKGRTLQWVAAIGSSVLRSNLRCRVGSVPVCGESEDDSAMEDIDTHTHAHTQTHAHTHTATHTDTHTHRCGRHDLYVSQFQAVCLLMFNKHDRLSVEDIQAATQIEENELKRQLCSLYINPKTRILLKEPSGAKELSMTDVYSLNTQFESSNLKIVINQIHFKESKEGVDEESNKIAEDRSCHIDAAVVRIMKSKQIMQHRDLVAEVLSQVKFNAPIHLIKKQLESLINRDFLRRDKDNSSIYVYVA